MVGARSAIERRHHCNRETINCQVKKKLTHPELRASVPHSCPHCIVCCCETCTAPCSKKSDLQMLAPSGEERFQRREIITEHSTHTDDRLKLFFREDGHKIVTVSGVPATPTDLSSSRIHVSAIAVSLSILFSCIVKWVYISFVIIASSILLFVSVKQGCFCARDNKGECFRGVKLL